MYLILQLTFTDELIGNTFNDLCLFKMLLKLIMTQNVTAFFLLKKNRSMTPLSVHREIHYLTFSALCHLIPLM